MKRYKRKKHKSECSGFSPMDGNTMIDLALAKMHIDKKKPQVSLSLEWKDVVGKKLADHVKPYDIEHGTLILLTDHPAWSQLVVMQEKKLLQDIKKCYPSLDIEKIAVRLTQ